MPLVAKRQNLIRIADKHGWDTVGQYVRDDFADDEDDDKRSPMLSPKMQRKGEIK